VSQYLQEIEHLPDTLGDLVEYYQTDTGKEKLDQWERRTRGQRELLFSGMGTSVLAPISIRARLADRGIDVRTIDSGEWLHYGEKLPGEQGTVVLISQSGESAEVRKIIEKGVAGERFVAITNNEKSFLGRHSTLCLPLCAGEEASISTKTYLNTLAVLHLMTTVRESSGPLENAFSELTEISVDVRWRDTGSIQEAARFLLGGRFFAFIGRGPSYLCAAQSALTMSEGARIVGAAYTGGGFRHGPLEAAGPDLSAIIYVAEGRTKPLMEKLARECAAAGTRVVCVTNAAIHPADNLLVIPVKNIQSMNNEHLFPMLAAPVHMLLIHFLAELKGFEAGKFRFCEKVTKAE
jgi:glucosamine--fructose-6-phosphate aminotransferase (isomerizing)